MTRYIGQTPTDAEPSAVPDTPVATESSAADAAADTQQVPTPQAPTPTPQTQPSVGGSILDVLGGLLGGGRR